MGLREQVFGFRVEGFKLRAFGVGERVSSSFWVPTYVALFVRNLRHFHLQLGSMQASAVKAFRVSDSNHEVGSVCSHEIAQTEGNIEPHTGSQTVRNGGETLISPFHSQCGGEGRQAGGGFSEP